MLKGGYIQKILRSNKTIFSTNDLAILWREPSVNATWVRINYHVRKGNLYRIRRGLYAKDENYDKLELAAKVYIPSYVSFETALTGAGIIFQFYSSIFAASYLTREIVVDGQSYSYRKIKDTVLTDTTGIINNGITSIASSDRAFLDTLYLNPDYHFDNLEALDWNVVFNILPIYKNKRMEKKVYKAFNKFQGEKK